MTVAPAEGTLEPNTMRPYRVVISATAIWVSFAIMLGGWIAFGIALIASHQTLADVWTAVRDLPLAIEGVAWLLGFPFLAGLAIWHASWGEAVRLVTVAVLAVAYIYMFRPRRKP